VRLALAQVDPKVGDIAGNTRLVLAAVRESAAQGADVTLLPELVLTGYPPEDLLAKSSFVRDNRAALEEVAAACEKAALVGFVDVTPDGRLFNAAALCEKHRVQRVYHKRRLPNYGVFDEERYFDPGSDRGLTELAGVSAGLTICEDVWVPELVAEDGEHGASLVLNISASPFHAGKGVEREEMLRGRARDNRVWLAYCNLVGGQDELVFDGRSVVISPSGEVVARAKAFEPDLLVVEFEPKGRLAPPYGVAPMVEG
jgi:NAD+ synthase (glutamine-hydrolysing)